MHCLPRPNNKECENDADAVICILLPDFATCGDHGTRKDCHKLVRGRKNLALAYL